ncbi:ankyrin repeat domain-containing protein [Wolbachia endosymbiont of Anopheles demeilloni]|uniref:ankyrin repeat domain-containing protein n=1 Tax=Wolbachia endosymbiont of Anopheles demeilloni TaxID=2748871 RepID=UPI001F18D3AB|nr:ankyrin repeat domain-containing protein [Wolbachia endosymbiont of Anopheles demeilloni]UIP93210.1 ankyrin repeat domain-containing protein [Wolbachia endosymbiont of Anopheles demeilloni]
MAMIWKHCLLQLKSCNLDTVKFLVKNVIDINATHHFGATSLHYATSGGCLEVVKFLIEEGIDINTTDAFSWTALHYAARKGHLEIAKFLLENGANPLAKNKDKKTPLDLAVEELNNNKEKKDIYEKMINLLSHAPITAVIIVR